MFNATNHQGNAIQNYNEKAPHNKSDATIRRHQVLDRMWRDQNTFELLLGMKNGVAMWKTVPMPGPP